MSGLHIQTLTSLVQNICKFYGNKLISSYIYLFVNLFLLIYDLSCRKTATNVLNIRYCLWQVEMFCKGNMCATFIQQNHQINNKLFLFNRVHTFDVLTYSLFIFMGCSCWVEVRSLYCKCPGCGFKSGLLACLWDLFPLADSSWPCIWGVTST